MPTSLTRVLGALVFLLSLAVTACLSYGYGFYRGAEPSVPVDYVQVLRDLVSVEGWSPTDRVRVFVPPSSGLGWKTENQDMVFEFSETQGPRVEVELPLIGKKTARLYSARVQGEDVILNLSGMPDITVPIQ